VPLLFSPYLPKLLRYAPGVTCKWRAKIRRKVSVLFTPIRAAISAWDKLDVSKSRRAASTRRASKCPAGVLPTACLKALEKLRGLIATTRAIAFTDKSDVRCSGNHASRSAKAFLSAFCAV
jgi:hypothetical protein